MAADSRTGVLVMTVFTKLSGLWVWDVKSKICHFHAI